MLLLFFFSPSPLAVISHTHSLSLFFSFSETRSSHALYTQVPCFFLSFFQLLSIFSPFLSLPLCPLFFYFPSPSKPPAGSRKLFFGRVFGIFVCFLFFSPSLQIAWRFLAPFFFYCRLVILLLLFLLLLFITASLFFASAFCFLLYSGFQT